MKPSCRRGPGCPSRRRTGRARPAVHPWCQSGGLGGRGPHPDKGDPATAPGQPYLCGLVTLRGDPLRPEGHPNSSLSKDRCSTTSGTQRSLWISGNPERKTWSRGSSTTLSEHRHESEAPDPIKRSPRPMSPGAGRRLTQ